MPCLPVSPEWGQRGYTYVALADVDRRVMKQALEMAWKNVVPERKREELGGGGEEPWPGGAAARAP